MLKRRTRDVVSQSDQARQRNYGALAQATFLRRPPGAPERAYPHTASWALYLYVFCFFLFMWVQWERNVQANWGRGARPGTSCAWLSVSRLVRHANLSQLSWQLTIRLDLRATETSEPKCADRLFRPTVRVCPVLTCLPRIRVNYVYIC